MTCTCNHQLQPHDRQPGVCPPIKVLPAPPHPRIAVEWRDHEGWTSGPEGPRSGYHTTRRHHPA